jgi:hypothetical protein
VLPGGGAQCSTASGLHQEVPGGAGPSETVAQAALSDCELSGRRLHVEGCLALPGVPQHQRARFTGLVVPPETRQKSETRTPSPESQLRGPGGCQVPESGASSPKA